MASRPLHELLQGHVFSCGFSASQQSFIALRVAALAGLQWANGCGAWIRGVSGTLASWGWTSVAASVAPWQWRHAQEGTVDILQETLS